ncbi:hypothetical protein A3F52_02400 [Candidatus Uhrbacteria bacterium RIFCSPHIGHO2_12_FULL_47_11]|nr:MAG: hypothetical protein A2753_00720 [Candidatus Uhrbacteria bacterium RIFCSPHIGHO2_01_FULL_47_11]OGL69128.1 MAG: hypothetical protein A3D58_02675 [Candidatus Uhrbacteria bacterium RIFCSPHIGHO2_02_FULL_46_47]OGL75737.1 MAG: hypothetical protein A3F52_02400 [Candidatus Uhrbacteria bacterium RIFCSPHIGHO2_12_FULL_47_11]
MYRTFAPYSQPKFSSVEGKAGECAVYITGCSWASPFLPGRKLLVPGKLEVRCPDYCVVRYGGFWAGYIQPKPNNPFLNPTHHYPEGLCMSLPSIFPDSNAKRPYTVFVQEQEKRVYTKPKRAFGVLFSHGPWVSLLYARLNFSASFATAWQKRKNLGGCALG